MKLLRPWREPPSIFQGRDSHLDAEGFGEVALVVESTFEGDGADRFVRFLQTAAGHEEAHFANVVARAHVEKAQEFALQLTNG